MSATVAAASSHLADVLNTQRKLVKFPMRKWEKAPAVPVPYILCNDHVIPQSSCPTEGPMEHIEVVNPFYDKPPFVLFCVPFAVLLHLLTPLILALGDWPCEAFPDHSGVGKGGALNSLRLCLA